MESTDLMWQISMLPDNLKSEVADFVAFLQQKNKPKEKIPRKPGVFKGLIVMAPDFDEPLDDFKPYM